MQRPRHRLCSPPWPRQKVIPHFLLVYASMRRMLGRPEGGRGEGGSGQGTCWPMTGRRGMSSSVRGGGNIPLGAPCMSSRGSCKPDTSLIDGHSNGGLRQSNCLTGWLGGGECACWWRPCRKADTFLPDTALEAANGVRLPIPWHTHTHARAYTRTRTHTVHNRGAKCMKYKQNLGYNMQNRG